MNTSKSSSESSKLKEDNIVIQTKKKFKSFSLVYIGIFLFIILMIVFFLNSSNFNRTKNINVGIIIDTVKGGEREKYVVTLANSFSKMKNIKVFLISNFPETEGFTIDRKVSAFNAYDEGNTFNVQTIKNLVDYHNISVLIYNNKDPNEINLLHSLHRKLIVINHEFIFEHLKYHTNHNYFKALKRADLIIDFIPDEIFLYKDAGLRNILYIPKFIPNDSKYIGQSNLKKKNVLLYGKGNDYKNFELGIKAMLKTVADVEDAKLKVVSNFNETTLNDLKDLVKDLRMQKSVQFVNTINTPEIFFNETSLIFIPSHTETSPSYLLEAKARGIPTIISGKRYIDSSKEGSIIVNDDNIMEMAKEAIRLFTDEKYMMSQSKAARESMKNFSFKIIADKWTNAINAVLNGNLNELVSEQKQMTDKLTGEGIIAHEFDLFKIRNPKQYCIEYLDIFDPLEGRAFKVCK